MSKPYNPRDGFFRRAKKEGYRARSVFKLEEIQERYKVIKKGDKVLDLGAAPGSFLQYISKIIGDKGFALGVDLKEIPGSLGENTATAVCDITNFDALHSIMEQAGIILWDVITSDIAPATTGIKDVDHARSIELSEQALDVAQQYLKSGGNIVFKVFTGEDFVPFLDKVKSSFKKVHCCKPKAVRDRSREMYIVGKGFLFESSQKTK